MESLSHASFFFWAGLAVLAGPGTGVAGILQLGFDEVSHEFLTGGVEAAFCLALLVQNKLGVLDGVRVGVGVGVGVFTLCLRIILFGHERVMLGGFLALYFGWVAVGLVGGSGRLVVSL